MDWDSKIAARDPYTRFRFGIPPSQDKADFAFIQHMFSSLNRTGQAAIICSQGILFRGSEEEKIRENMIKEDIIEGIIALPPKLFYGTGIPAVS
jgi:type I restriction enzyme M protein